MESRPKLLAIVGPTASGKSNLSQRLAALTRSEIICADSRTIYKGMDVGTAKPTPNDRLKVPHWGLDLADPGEIYSAKLYQHYAKGKIGEITARGHLPIIVGGTGLYVDSVLYDFEFIESRNKFKREDLEKMSLNELSKIIESSLYQMPENFKNKRHLIRTIERGGVTGSKKGLMSGAIVIGLLPSDDTLRSLIANRAESMFSGRVMDETQELIDRFGKQAIVNTGGIIYKICIQILDGEISQEHGLELFRNADWQYAKRQRTWFKRNPDVMWFRDKDKAYLYLRDILNT